MKTRTQENLSTRIATALVQHSARRAPPPLAERLEEEWLADLAEQSHGLARIQFALGCWWARHVIASEALNLNVATTHGAAGGASAYLPSDPALFSRRTVALLVIVAAHVGAYYAFTSGILSRIVTVFPPPMIATTVDVPHQKEPVTKLPPARLDRVLVDYDPRELTSTIPTLADPTIDVVVPAVGDGDPLPPPLSAGVHRVAGGPGRGFPNAEDFYPSVSRTLYETGAAAVQVCVDTAGRLTALPSLVASSGYPRLDTAALAVAKAGSGHYRSTTEDGKPVSACYPFKVRFALRDR